MYSEGLGATMHASSAGQPGLGRRTEAETSAVPRTEDTKTVELSAVYLENRAESGRTESTLAEVESPFSACRDNSFLV